VNKLGAATRTKASSITSAEALVKPANKACNRHATKPNNKPDSNPRTKFGTKFGSGRCNKLGRRSSTKFCANPDIKLSANRGFTLVEVVLALALTSLILGLLSTGVYIVSEDWNRNSDVLDDSLDEALVILQIDRALHGAFPHSFTDQENLSRQIYFIGEDDHLSWVSTVSPQRSAGLTTWELYSDGKLGVQLSLVPAFADDPTERLSQSEPQLVLEGYNIEFAYLFDDLDERRVWRDEWLGEEMLGLPLAVYVNLIPFAEYEDSKQPIEIIARIKNNNHRSIRPNTVFGSR
jgi:general secretion pathway protein J